MIVLTIPEATPSGNKYAYSSWHVRFRDKKRWGKMLFAARAKCLVGDVYRETHNLKPKRVTVERYAKGRKLDVDNFAGGLKGILDGLKELNLIVDDSEQWLELVLKQPTRAKGEPVRTVITIEDI